MIRELIIYTFITKNQNYVKENLFLVIVHKMIVETHKNKKIRNKQEYEVLRHGDIKA